MLQRITITDSKKKGVKLCLSGEKLAECRDTFRMRSLSNMGRSWTLENMRVGYVPVLQLPMSEYVMKGVTIVNYKMFAGDDYEVYKAMVDAFAEEQDVFSEAVVQIQEKHKDCMTNWAANFTAKLDGVMVLYVASLSKIMESEQEEEDETDEQEEDD
ncbi:hypothetical protein RHMOL_Rhmol13G0282500 [Rhododendron molle]|uniref:Uncharacterized protein n=1 Tax=Rhododendron molle TaxID=49168 RepID=A0ACC0LBK4_RHOML|nr:hypothetical protein RHMOL_Rhmol13G0282500 [Rhododendron molle]